MGLKEEEVCELIVRQHSLSRGFKCKWEPLRAGDSVKKSAPASCDRMLDQFSSTETIGIKSWKYSNPLWHIQSNQMKPMKRLLWWWLQIRVLSHRIPSICSTCIWQRDRDGWALRWLGRYNINLFDSCISPLFLCLMSSALKPPALELDQYNLPAQNVFLQKSHWSRSTPKSFCPRQMIVSLRQCWIT